MNIVALWRDISAALDYGKSLQDPAKWANRATRTGLISNVLAAVVAVVGGLGYAFDLSPSDINAIAAGISAAVAVFGVISDRLHRASNENAR